MADIIDINVYETVETVTINAQPNLTTINVNSVTSVSPVTSVNGQIGDVVIPTSDNNFTNALKTKLDGIATGAEVNVNADWNATSGDAQILNKPTIPTQTSQLTNNGADGTNPFITALDIPTAGQAGTLVREVKNMTGATLTKGTVVYISGANGNKPLVSKALATTDVLSARTFGLLQSSISNNGVGYCVIIGDLSGLDTSAFTEGVQLYLSGVTAGTYTSTKTLAPTHLVYIGKVTRSHPTLGQIEVGIQNGYELEEIHDVAISSVADKQLLSYDVATDLWKNKSVTTADIADSTNKRYVTDANLTTIGNQSGTNTGDETNATIKTKLGAATTSSDGYLTSTNWNTFNGKFNLPSLTSGSVLFSDGTTIAQKNSNFFWDNTNNRLGIGTASPTAKLQIELADNGISTVFKSLGGQIRLRGYLSANYGGVIESYNTLGTLNERLTISASKIQLLDGNVLVNTFTDNGGKLQIKAGGALSTDIALRVRNSADTADLFQVNGLQVLVKSNFVSSTVTPVSFIYSDNTNALQIIEGSGAKYVDLGGSVTQIRTSGLLQSQITGTTAAIGLSSFCFRVQGNGQTLFDEAGVNAFVATSALLEMKATTKGFLPPRMTTTQKNAIASPASGLVVYDTTLNKLCVRGASAWETITSI